MSAAGKVALVTGAARERGIGRGIVRRLAADGYAVAINDVAAADAAAAGEALRDELERGGQRAGFHPADVSDHAAVEAMFDAVERELGPVDVVCSNAGVGAWSPFAETSEAELDRVVAVNLTGAFHVAQAGARRMLARRRGGRIVFVSSVHVEMPFPEMAVYGATKQAMRALAETMAIELGGAGITVNHVGPGWVKSQLNDASPSLQTEAEERETMAKIPLGRPAEPAEIGAAVSYLCGADAAYVNGAFLRVDGGFVVGKY